MATDATRSREAAAVFRHSQVRLAAFEGDGQAGGDGEAPVGQAPEPPGPKDALAQADQTVLAVREPSAFVTASDAESPPDGSHDRSENLAQLPFFPNKLPWLKSGNQAAGPEVGQTQKIMLRLDDVPVPKALEMLSRPGALNILVSPGVTGRVTADLQNLDFDQALDAILRLCNLVARQDNDVLFVYTPEEVPHRERSLRTFPLDFVAGSDVLLAVQGLLSPVGQAFVTETLSSDNRKTQDCVVVDDLPEHLEKVEQYVAQIDVPPRQVLIEVHVLEVELDDNWKHGVNFDHVISMMGNTVELKCQKLANPLDAGFYINVNGDSMKALIECLKTTTDAKTLASPRVLALNGQESRIQIGERFGYRVTRVTETAAVEDVEFLDLGVVLTVTARVSRDNRVVMKVKPEVSSGKVNPDTNLPEEETTEVETDVLLSDGQGIVIGGLIQEKDSNVQSKLPWLGDLRWVGLLFQHRQVQKTRSEIIITLMPRVLPYPSEYEARDQMERDRAETPLVHGPLCKYPRPWEPILPDTLYNPRSLRHPCVDPSGCPPPRCYAPDNRGATW